MPMPMLLATSVRFVFRAAFSGWPPRREWCGMRGVVRGARRKVRPRRPCSLEGSFNRLVGMPGCREPGARCGRCARCAPPRWGFGSPRALFRPVLRDTRQPGLCALSSVLLCVFFWLSSAHVPFSLLLSPPCPLVLRVLVPLPLPQVAPVTSHHLVRALSVTLHALGLAGTGTG